MTPQAVLEQLEDLTLDPNTTALVGIPKVSAVQEMAYRQGQRDRGMPRERAPASPFAEQFDDIWLEFYVMGTLCGAATGTQPTATANTSGRQRFSWPVLINPYTQDLQHPNGVTDTEWTRKMCAAALNCMVALIRTVCKREKDWNKIVCDVPLQIQVALQDFADLQARYVKLKQDAHEALKGGFPAGY
jgi:hypothetical protein